MKKIHEPVHWDISLKDIRLHVGTKIPDDKFFEDNYDYALDKTMAEIKRQIIARFTEDIDKLVCFYIYRQDKSVEGFVDLKITPDNYEIIKGELNEIASPENEKSLDILWDNFF